MECIPRSDRQKSEYPVSQKTLFGTGHYKCSTKGTQTNLTSVLKQEQETHDDTQSRGMHLRAKGTIDSWEVNARKQGPTAPLEKGSFCQHFNVMGMFLLF